MVSAYWRHPNCMVSRKNRSLGQWGWTIVNVRREDGYELDCYFGETSSVELNHHLRTSLAVIRIQAQLLLRLTKRELKVEPEVLDRYLTGLTRIDQAVTSLSDRLDAVTATLPKNGGRAPAQDHGEVQRSGT